MDVSRPLPPVEKIRPGTWSLPVPIPDNPLGYTLVYLLDSDRGPVLIDTGWDADVSFAALAAAVSEAGFALEDTYGVLVTHQHPDHHGLSGRVREVSGAWVAMHPADAEVVTRRRETDDAWILQTAAYLLDAGVGPEAFATLPDPEELLAQRPPRPVLPNRLFAHGERLDVPGRDIRAVWTPGHTPGHTCFVDTADRVLFSGDHILPRITPHIGLMHPDRDPSDPLGSYLASLEEVAGLDVEEVLPAHEHRFADLRGRVAEIRAHHEQRLEEVRRILRDGPQPAWAITERMTWNRSWQDIHFMMRRAALAEVLAHLRYLERRGEVVVDDAVTPTLYRLPGPAEVDPSSGAGAGGTGGEPPGGG